MKHNIITLLIIAIAPFAFSDEVYRQNPNPPTDGLVGSNYTPAYAVNQVQFWHDFRPAANCDLAKSTARYGRPWPRMT